MKKIVLGLFFSLSFFPGLFSGLFSGLFLSLPSVHAAARTDDFGGDRAAVWRSSFTCISLNFVTLATGSVIVHSLQISSAEVNNGASSFVSIFNSTTGPMTGGSNIATFSTTGTFTVTTVPTGASVSPPIFIYDVPFTTGAVVNKLGVACTTIFWDFAVPKIDFFKPRRP